MAHIGRQRPPFVRNVNYHCGQILRKLLRLLVRFLAVVDRRLLSKRQWTDARIAAPKQLLAGARPRVPVLNSLCLKPIGHT